MTVANDITRAPAPVAPLIAKKPPKFAMGELVVLRGYEDGWRWTVIDAVVLGRKNPHWEYTCQTVRPYDGKTVECTWPEWKLRPVPVGAASGAS